MVYGLTVTGGTKGTDYTYSNGLLTILTDTPMTIRNTAIGSTGDRILVADGVSADITLAGVNIERNDGSGSTAGTAAFMIADNSTGNVTITLADGSDNRLESGELCAGLQKNGDYSSTLGMLTIKGGMFGTGKLNATGGDYGAGIGGGFESTGSNIEINGGTVNATGRDYGAGIGGGFNSTGSNIEISGGTVTANGSYFGAGIGGGEQGAGNNIRISGGSVKAVAEEGANAIGGGTGKAAVTPTSDGTTSVYLTTLDIGAVSSASVKLNGEATATTYSAHPNGDTNLYFYLPVANATAEYNSKDYEADVVANNNNVFAEARSVITVTANGTTSSYSKQANGWKAAVGKPDGTQVTVKLLANWNAVGGSFGSGDGFGSTGSEYILIPDGKNIVLDLNGCTINRGMTLSADNGVVIRNNGTLEVVDSGTTGEITGGKNTTTGGGIYNGGNLTINGGRITGNSANKGGGVYNSGTLTVGGNTVITDNTTGTGSTSDNLYLPTGRTITVAPNGFKNSARIGITTETNPSPLAPIGITSARDSDYSAFFRSDAALYDIRNTGSGANQVVKLANVFSFSVNGHNVPAGNGGTDITPIDVSADGGVMGGIKPYTFGLETGAPDWLSIDSSTGIITGTRPDAASAEATATIKITDSSTPAQSKTITITVGAVSNATYTVTLNTCGGTINSGNVTGYTFGSEVTLPTDITRDGFDFGGWYENAGFTGSAVTEISSTATGNKEYHAKWKLLTYDVTLSYTTIDFGSIMEGYSDAPAAQTITIMNNGNSDITAFAVTASNAYDVSYTSGAITANGGRASFTVRPNTGLAKGDYSETLSITTVPAQTTAVKLDVKFSVDNAPTLSADAETANVGEIVTLTATDVKGAEYKWYSNTSDSAVGGTLILGMRSNTYRPSTADAGVNYYYVTINGIATNVVPITVSEAAKQSAAVEEKKPEAVSTFRFISGIKGFKLGWNGVKEHITYKMDSGDSMVVEMSPSVRLIPRSVIETMMGKDVTITFVSGEYSKTINGKDIKKPYTLDITK